MEQRDSVSVGARILTALRAELRRLLSGNPSEQRTPIVTATWDAFLDGLAFELSRLKVGSKVIIYDSAEWLAYVQFAKDANSLYAEAVSNRFLPDDRQLAPEGEQRLALAGWQPPQDRRYANWWLAQSLPLASDEFAQVAKLAVVALRDALRIAEPSELEYRAWNDRTSEALDLPALHPSAEPPYEGKATSIEPES